MCLHCTVLTLYCTHAGSLRGAVGSALQAASTLAAVTDLVGEQGLWAKKLRNSIFDFDRSLMDFVKSALPPSLFPPLDRSFDFDRN